MKPDSPFSAAVYRLVRDIPPGRVMTYGQVATLVGHPRGARAVGQAMLTSGTANPPVPWQRVINACGQISHGGDPYRPAHQRNLLAKEGIRFGPDDGIDLSKYRWEPDDSDTYRYETDTELPFSQ